MAKKRCPQIFTLQKEEFLATLRKPDGQFKRPHSASVIRYAGGKTRAVGIISQYLPDVLPKKILSPFIGGGSLEVVWANNLDVDEVIGCDINLPLVNFWQVLLSQPEDLANNLLTLKATREEYNRVKKIIKDWYEGKIQLSDLDAAAYYFHNTQLSYGPMFPGYVSNKYCDDDLYKRLVERVRVFRAPKLRVKHLSFEQSLQKYNEHFVYADPPYLLGYDSTVFCGMYPNRNWPTDHEGFKHETLRDLMINRTQWIMSYNDCGTVRSWYKNYRQEFPKWTYTYQQGETRKDGVKGARDNSKQCREILIINV